jgi:DNA polymerase
MGGLGPQIDGAEALSALQWWLDAGVDVLVGDRPRNWLGEMAHRQPEVHPEPAAPAPARTEVPQTLALFREWLASSPDEPGARSKPVRPQGQESAEVMLIAEPPGREEAQAGSPIAGEAAALAERMLAAIRLSPAQAYFANLHCFYSPGAKPARDQLQRWAELTRRHVALAKPKRLLLLGDLPARALLGKTLAEARGHVHQVEGIRAVVTFHPRFLLDQPSSKRRAWEDLLLLMDESR